MKILLYTSREVTTPSPGAMYSQLRQCYFVTMATESMTHPPTGTTVMSTFQRSEGLTTELTHRDFIVLNPVGGHISYITLRYLQITSQTCVSTTARISTNRITKMCNYD